MEIKESNIYSVFDILYKQYEKERLDYFKKHKKISDYDTENIMYHLLNKVLEDYKDLTFTFRYPVNILIKDKEIKEYFDLEVKFNLMIADVNKIIAEAIKNVLK